MRKILAIIVCKILRIVGKMIGKEKPQLLR